jgi:hypothetical protein
LLLYEQPPRLLGRYTFVKNMPETSPSAAAGAASAEDRFVESCMYRAGKGMVRYAQQDNNDKLMSHSAGMNHHRLFEYVSKIYPPLFF